MEAGVNEAELVHAIEGMVSPGRFHRYRAGAGTDLDAVTRYLWNVRLAEALFPAIAVFEVTLRNAVHQVLTRHAGTEFWFKSVLQQQTNDNIVQLMGTLTRRTGNPPSADKVISEITSASGRSFSRSATPHFGGIDQDHSWQRSSHITQALPEIHGRNSRRVSSTLSRFETA